MKTKKVCNTLADIVEKHRNRGAEFVGATLHLRVAQVASAQSSLIRDAILDDPIVPNDWAPEMLSDLTVYLQTMVELNLGASLEKKFLPDANGGYEIDPETHSGYFVKRLFLRRNDRVPTAHKILHLEKRIVENADGSQTVEDIEADTGITISLIRSAGSAATDDTGGSSWKFRVHRTNPDTGIDERISHCIPERYHPFIRTLTTKFGERRAQTYCSQQIRDLVTKIILNDIRAESLPRPSGVYFVPPHMIEKVNALSRLLEGVDPGIVMFVMEIPLVDDEYEDTNSLYGLVSNGLETTMQNELAAFIEDLEKLDTATGTRDNTWKTRTEQALDFKARLKRYHDLRLLDENQIKAQYMKAVSIIKRNVGNDTNP